MTDEAKDVPVIGFSFKQTLDDYREIVFQGFVPATCTAAEMNEMLDKVSTASDRQKAKTHLPTVKGLLDVKKDALVTETNNLFLAEAERETQSDLWRKQAETSNKRNWVPSPAQKQDHVRVQGRIAQHEQNIKVLRKEVSVYEQQLADYEAKAEA